MCYRMTTVKFTETRNWLWTHRPTDGRTDASKKVLHRSLHHVSAVIRYLVDLLVVSELHVYVSLVQSLGQEGSSCFIRDDVDRLLHGRIRVVTVEKVEATVQRM